LNREPIGRPWIHDVHKKREQKRKRREKRHGRERQGIVSKVFASSVRSRVYRSYHPTAGQKRKN
jgi:hypothetical protein